MDFIDADTGECDRVRGRLLVASMFGRVVQKQADRAQSSIEILVWESVRRQFVDTLQIVERHFMLINSSRTDFGG